MHLPGKKGFTLVELMVVISIIAILSVVGITVFTNARKNANDGKRRADVDAISKAYEVYYAANSKYEFLTDAQFASGKPKDPRGDNYYEYVESDYAYKTCAVLEGHSGGTTCNTPSNTCYCRSSQQGSPPTGSASYIGNDGGIGWGSSTPSSCDTFGTLDDNLVGYWKMEESSWTPGSATVKDYSGNSYNGTPSSGATIVSRTPTLTGSSLTGNFNGTTTASINAGTNLASQFQNKDFTVSAWMYFNDTDTLDRPLLSIGSPILDQHLHLTRRGNKLFMGFYGDDIQANTTLNSGLWYFVAFTWNATSKSRSIYLNSNNPDKTGNSTGLLNVPSGSILYLGQYASRNQSGLIDDLRIYNRVLSSPEINLLASGCVSP